MIAMCLLVALDDFAVVELQRDVSVYTAAQIATEIHTVCVLKGALGL
jgi:hypothetical protein